MTPTKPGNKDSKKADKPKKAPVVPNPPGLPAGLAPFASHPGRPKQR